MVLSTQRERRAVRVRDQSRCRCRSRGAAGRPRGSRRSAVALVGTQATSTPAGLMIASQPDVAAACRRAGVPVRRARRLDDERAEQAVVDRGAVAGPGVDVVPALEATGRSGSRTGRSRSARARRRRRGWRPPRRPRRRTVELEPVDVQPESPPVAGLVNVISTQSPSLARMTSGWIGSSRSPIETFLRRLLARGSAAMPLVRAYILPLGSWSPKRFGDVDVDGGDVEGTVDGAAGQAAGGCCRRRRGRRRAAESGDRRRQRSADRDREEAS